MLTSKSMLSLPGFWCFWHKNSSSDSLETLSSRSTLFLFVFLGLGESSSSSVYHLCLEPSNISWISSNGKDLIFIPRQHFVGQYAYVVGWGRTQHGVAATPSLLQVRLSYMSRWLGPERFRNPSFVSRSPESTICQPSTAILIIVVFFPSLTSWLHDHLWQYQEVKVQVISAEKCQSWFQSAHRQETLLIRWGCQG